MNLVSSVHEGFYNIPKLYGSEVREQGKVTDFGSGMKEAGKGFFYGYYDGITGLVREPMEGAKKGGILGAIKGAGLSCKLFLPLLFENLSVDSHKCEYETCGWRSWPCRASYSGRMEKYAKNVGQRAGTISAEDAIV